MKFMGMTSLQMVLTAAVLVCEIYQPAAAQSTSPTMMQTDVTGDGLRPWAFSASLGRLGTHGDYYEGVADGMSIRIGGQYRFLRTNPCKSTYFVKGSIAHSSPGWDIETYGVGDDYGYDYGYGDMPTIHFEDVSVRTISLELGRTTPLATNDSHMFITTGLSFIKNTGTAYAMDQGKRIDASYTESNATLRMTGGGVIGVTPRLGISLDVCMDFMLTKGEPSAYEYQASPEVAGALMLFGAGIVYEL